MTADLSSFEDVRLEATIESPENKDLSTDNMLIYSQRVLRQSWRTTLAEPERPIIRRDGVRFLADNTDVLTTEMRRLRSTLREIIKEIKPEDCPILIEEHFDGIWAKGLIKSVHDLGATGIEINEWWASLVPDWTCPCCQRTKVDIVHLSGGVLIAKAVEHHDHFTSYVNRSFSRDLGLEWAKNTPHLHDVQRQMVDAFCAFPPAVICESCNQADRDAKSIVRKSLGIPKEDLEYFSFSVDEIRSFIRGANKFYRGAKNSHHHIDDEKVIKLFLDKKKHDVLRIRIGIVDKNVGLVAQGIHWRSPEYHLSGSDLYEETWDILNELGVTLGGNFELLEYSATTRTGTMPANTWRKNRTRRTTAPSPDKITQYVAARPHLTDLGPNWRCPCCNRSISAIVRINKKREPTMLVAAVGADSARIEVCMDCLDVWRGLAKESDVARDDVTRDDVRAVIVPVRNSRHKLKSDLAADQQVAAIADRCARVSQDGDDEDDGFVAI